VPENNDKIALEINFFFPQESKMSEEAMDDSLAKKLWEKSVVMVGLGIDEIRF
jgi:hypothetical protein